MALDENILANLLKSEVEKLRNLSTSDGYHNEFYLAIARAIISHIKDAAEVTGSSVSGGAVTGSII